MNVTRRRTRQPGLRQTECRKSHVNSARRLICKHNARQLYGLPSSGRMRSLRVSPVSLVNFSRRPVRSTLVPSSFPIRPTVYRYSSCSTSSTASLCPGTASLNVLTIVFSFVRAFHFSSFHFAFVPRLASSRVFLSLFASPLSFFVSFRPHRRQKYVSQIKENPVHGARFTGRIGARKTASR